MSNYSISTRVNLPFHRALLRTRNALREEEFVVITEIDLQAELLQKLGQQTSPHTIFGVWVPSWESEALKAEPETALLMPSHVCLWENSDGTCTLATADLKHLFNTKNGSPSAQAALAVNARLRAVAASVHFAGAVDAIATP